MIDVFIYVVVLNLAIQYLPAVISETFTLSLTAALLKVTLELVLLLKAPFWLGFAGQLHGWRRRHSQSVSGWWRRGASSWCSG